ncbi:MAG: DUF4411 family protein [Actinobacteria bacterium]|nr:DUF4411 family protein [Actinomycetota bacterium]
MNDARRCYSVDTSALIDGLERYYPEEHFPGLWERVDEVVAEGRLIISEEVWEEAQSKDAVVKAWCEPRKDAIIVPTDATVVQEVQRVLVGHKRLVMNLKGRNRADPFVIAVASIRGAVVVTGEGSDGTDSRPKIPFVCAHLDIECVRFLDVIRLEGWRF